MVLTSQVRGRALARPGGGRLCPCAGTSITDRWICRLYLEPTLKTARARPGRVLAVIQESPDPDCPLGCATVPCVGKAGFGPAERLAAWSSCTLKLRGPGGRPEP